MQLAYNKRVKDLVIGVVCIIQPWHWDDVILGSVYTVTHLKKVISAIYNEIKQLIKNKD